ncbi:hypothetical protein H261_09727 [Paramagnetospirillum caucaseum]|uniref:Uncharacterized protein n=1 Tax=Paramagnetospirillum caucaseum TaxID=1244869 RepID=M3ACG4_9PROT|nr:hypothetical protein [Paramagnetospirillum caucaseum]EME70204.1 hypothetical protein H261_09727 [Paramagnetospirillum caucaseum]
MTLSPELSFDAHIAPILAGPHAPGLPSCILEIQRLLARLDFPSKATRRAASIVAYIQHRLSSRLAGNLQRWKDLGEAEKLLYIVMELEQTNFRFNAFATIHLKGTGNEIETAEQLVADLQEVLRHVDPMAEVLAVEALDRGIRHVHCLVSLPKAPSTRAGRVHLRDIVGWFDERNGRPGIAWKNGSGVPAHLEWLDEQKVFQRVGIGGLLGAACYMAAQREMRLVAGRNLRAIGKQLHAEARDAVRLAGGGFPIPLPASPACGAPIDDGDDAKERTLPAFDAIKLAQQERERSWWRLPPLISTPPLYQGSA